MAKLKVEKFYRKIWRFGRFAFCKVECYRKTDAELEIEHQKYKRCIAMADWCNSEKLGMFDNCCYNKMIWYDKWYNKWRMIAKKFKPEGK